MEVSHREAEGCCPVLSLPGAVLMTADRRGNLVERQRLDLARWTTEIEQLDRLLGHS